MISLFCPEDRDKASASDSERIYIKHGGPFKKKCPRQRNIMPVSNSFQVLPRSPLNPGDPFALNITCFLNSQLPLWFAGIFFFSLKLVSKQDKLPFPHFQALLLVGPEISFKLQIVKVSWVSSGSLLQSPGALGWNLALEGAMDLWLWSLCFLPGKCHGKASHTYYEVRTGHRQGSCGPSLALLFLDGFRCRPVPRIRMETM